MKNNCFMCIPSKTVHYIMENNFALCYVLKHSGVNSRAKLVPAPRAYARNGPERCWLGMRKSWMALHILSLTVFFSPLHQFFLLLQKQLQCGNYIERFIINPGNSCDWTLSSKYTSTPFKLVACFLIVHFFGEVTSTRSQSST